MSNQEPKLDVEFFRSLAHGLRTQDNAGTADPYVTVQEEVTDYGFEAEYGEDVDWFRDDGEYTKATPAQAKRLERIYQATYEVRDGWTRTFTRTRWEFREAFLTVKAAREFIERQRHNHGKLRVYIESACRNPEMRKLREQLLAVAEHLNGGGAS